MGYNEDDPFESIVNQFFGGARGVRRSRVKRVVDEEDQNTQFIEEEDYVYLIVELPGYSEKDIDMEVDNDTITVSAKAKQIVAQDYLARKQKEGITIEQIVPENIRTKNFKKTFRNGVLEVTFEKR
ncbi:MAG: Hsp20/alpha crystallin family protein [Candidatus Pacearchaeota archaeon]